VIVVDDGSADGTGGLAKKIKDKRIRYVRSDKNRGTSNARNRGLKAAKGEYIAYCDHDDTWYKHHLKIMVSVLDRHPDVGLVYARCHLVGRWKGYFYDHIYPKDYFSEKSLEGRNIVGPPTNVVHRKTCIDRAGYFGEGRTVVKHSCEDWDLWIRIYDNFKFYRLNTVLSKMNFHGGNRSESVNWGRAHAYIVQKRMKHYEAKGMLEWYALSSFFTSPAGLLLNPKDARMWGKIAHKLIGRGKKSSLRPLREYSAAIDFFNNKKYAKAKKIFENLLTDYRKNGYPIRELTPTVQVALFHLCAKCEERLGRFRRAIALHKKILHIDRDDVSSINALPLLYYVIGEHKAAFALARRYPSKLTHNMFGIHFMKLGQHGKAISCFKRALAFDPRFHPARRNLTAATKLSRFSIPSGNLYDHRRKPAKVIIAISDGVYVRQEP
jgi:glycosyltransferase involved in cell wall biosynthesis